MHNRFIIFALGFVLGYMLGSSPAHSRWKPEYAQLPQATQDWYQAQKIMPNAQHRFTYTRCCDGADLVKTQFRVNKTNGNDQWYYQKEDGTWKKVPDDIIHWEEPTPDGQAVLFVFEGVETCFYPPLSGN